MEGCPTSAPRMGLGKHEPCDRRSPFQEAQRAANHARKATVASCGNVEETLLVLRVHLSCTAYLRDHPLGSFVKVGFLRTIKQGAGKKKFHEHQRRERTKCGDLCDDFVLNCPNASFSESVPNVQILPLPFT